MGKQIKNAWLQRKNELIVYLAVTVGMAVLVTLGVFIIVKGFDTFGDMTYALFGAFLGFIMFLMVSLVSGVLGYSQQFSMAVSMGQTRREFFLCNLCAEYVYTFIILLIITGMALLERGIAAICYTEMTCEVDATAFLLNGILLFIVFLLLPPVKLLLGYVYLRYQMKAFWVFYAIFMLPSVLAALARDLYMQIINAIAKMANAFISMAGNGNIVILSLTVLAALLCGGGAWLLGRKQEVRL